MWVGAALPHSRTTQRIAIAVLCLLLHWHAHVTLIDSGRARQATEVRRQAASKRLPLAFVGETLWHRFPRRLFRMSHFGKQHANLEA